MDIQYDVLAGDDHSLNVEENTYSNNVLILSEEQKLKTEPRVMITTSKLSTVTFANNNRFHDQDELGFANIKNSPSLTVDDFECKNMNAGTVSSDKKYSPCFVVGDTKIVEFNNMVI